MARFEVLGLDADRALIRSLARRLADNGPDSGQIRAVVRHTISGSPPKTGGILNALRRSPLVGANLEIKRPRTPGRQIDLSADLAGQYLLDTNIISNVTKPLPSEALVAWMVEQNDEDLFICSLTVAEIRRGLLEKPAGKKRRSWNSLFLRSRRDRKRCLQAACSPSTKTPVSFGRG